MTEAKTVSRQRQWQLRMKAAGRCMQCGAAVPCKKCSLKRAAREARKRGGSAWKPGNVGRIPGWYKERINRKLNKQQP